jgi:hypothetical protein
LQCIYGKRRWHLLLFILTSEVTDRRDKPWFWAYNDIFECGLSARAICIYTLFCRQVSNSTRPIFPTYGYIYRKTGIKDHKTIRKALDELVAAGLLEIRQRRARGQAANYYKLLNRAPLGVKVDEFGNYV